MNFIPTLARVKAIRAVRECSLLEARDMAHKELLLEKLKDADFPDLVLIVGDLVERLM